ncbi:hypothetical protein C0J52_06562 [Blattella germanica]|nr:hypothetical protein C0J52_06562 [Blattella germanica]
MNMNLVRPGKVVLGLQYTGGNDLYDVEFRTLADCRDGNFHQIRRKWNRSRVLMQLPYSQAVAMSTYLPLPSVVHFHHHDQRFTAIGVILALCDAKLINS